MKSLNGARRLVLCLCFGSIAPVSSLGCGAASSEPETAEPDFATPQGPTEAELEAMEEVSEWTDGKVTGVVQFAPNAKAPSPPEDFKLQLTIGQGTGGADVAKMEKVLGGEPPYAFELQADISQLDKKTLYMVSGFIVAPSGELYYGIKEPVKVFVKGEKAGPVEILMIPTHENASQ